MRRLIGLFALLLALPAGAQVTRQVSEFNFELYDVPSIVGDGSRVYVSSTANDLGSNPRFAYQVLEIDSLTAAAAQIGGFPEGASGVSASDDGSLLAFRSSANPVGSNSDESFELFLMNSDGSGVVQLTDTPAASGDVSRVAISGSGNTTENPEGNDEVWKVNRDSSGRTALTQFGAGLFSTPLALADGGQRVIAQAAGGDFPGGGNADGGAELLSVAGDGSGFVQLTRESD